LFSGGAHGKGASKSGGHPQGKPNSDFHFGVWPLPI
jgi:hypothetical protein